MTKPTNISSYLCHVVGETPERAARFHPSTVRRTKAFAIAIHIPVLLWAVTGFVIASQIFHQSDFAAAGVAFMCAGLIYLVERLVLATPKAWFVNISRVLIGLVISILGASTVDLVIFDREISEQLLLTGEATLIAEHDAILAAQANTVAQKKADWFKAQEAANCEANGTCGSKLRSVGPVYRELARQAELLRQEYMEAQAQLVAAAQNKKQALAQWRAAPPNGDKAGLLARVQALHEYTTHNTAALVAWVLFFTLVLFFELMVVLSKLVFGDTVDDELDRIRERISQQKAHDYMEAVTSPVAGARALITASYG
ncbi:MAG: DUF4407 domain-containing protein [Candidatus Saccharibacteria bacterium]|nr:DUF4407 domain-containing protein [Rhodoferax sp.]